MLVLVSERSPCLGWLVAGEIEPEEHRGVDETKERDMKARGGLHTLPPGVPIHALRVFDHVKARSAT